MIEVSPQGKLVTSTQSLHRFYLHAVRERPQYGSLLAFLFPTGARIDTDGDSIPAISITWTWLSIRKDDEIPVAIEIYPAQQTPLILVVESKSIELAARAVYYLATSMDTAVLVTETGPAIDLTKVEAAMGNDFDITSAMLRVNHPTNQVSAERHDA